MTRMRLGGRRLLSLLAIYAIALHTILWGAGIPYAGASVDPFSVICHSEADAPAGQTPAEPASAPTHACDHCNICNAMAPPAPEPGAVIALLSPPSLLAILRPTMAVVPDGLSDNPNRARGPPAVA